MAKPLAEQVRIEYTKLEREVALKFLLSQLLGIVDVHRRFEREAEGRRRLPWAAIDEPGKESGRRERSPPNGCAT